MPFGVLFSIFGIGVALMGLQIRLSGQVRGRIEGPMGTNGRIERVEERLSGQTKAVRTELNGRIDQVRGEVKGAYIYKWPPSSPLKSHGAQLRHIFE